MSEETTPADNPAPDAPAETPNPAAEAPPELPTQAQVALQKLMAEDARIRKAAQDLEARAAKVDRLEKLASLPKEQLAQELGLSLQDFQKHTIDNFDPTQGLKQEVSDLKAMWRKREQEETARAKAAAIQEASELVRTYIDSSTDFPVIKKLGAQDQVYSYMRQQEQAGNSISEAKAASEVEKLLREQVEKALELDLWKKAPSEPEPTSTLTNSNTSDTPQVSQTKTVLDESSRIDAFAALLRLENS